MSLILGIETSCDETSIALLEKTFKKINVHFHQTYSQEEIFKDWGGVIPEIAARNHLLKLTPLLQQCFKQSNIMPKDLTGIGVTVTPGLLGPLLTGLAAAKTLSLLYQLPLFPVNHLYAHLEAIHLSETISYPYIGLLVSGGHTLFFLVHSSSQFTVLGSTVDDAVGEAFDKGGKILGFEYPAGKMIDDLAREGNPLRFPFPIGKEHTDDAQMSFSGVKNALRLFIEKRPEIKNNQAELKDVCASYQHALIQALVKKLTKAKEIVHDKYSLENLPIVVGGGVACNSYLRKNLPQAFFVKPAYCTDNGAMIAHLALKNINHFISYPDCLSLDATGKFLSLP